MGRKDTTKWLIKPTGWYPEIPLKEVLNKIPEFGKHRCSCGNLINPGVKKCKDCKSEARKERNKRYYEKASKTTV